ncbi:unnamed protein product, partial [Medioppia subpectinata]
MKSRAKRTKRLAVNPVTDALPYHYNLRSSASSKRLRVDDRSSKTITADRTTDSQLLNSQNCEEMSDSMDASTLSQTSVVQKLTKMPNKSYNLRRRVGDSASKAGRHSSPAVSRTTIDDLPDDCLLDIFEKLDTIQDKCALQRVNKRFYFLVNRLLKAQKTFTVGSTFGDNNEQMLTQRICRTIIKRCPNLETFKMPGFYTKTSTNTLEERIGDKEMFSLGRKCKELRELDICGCGNVTERGINYIADVCPKLEKLSISFCLQVSGASLQKLTKNFRTLSINTNDMTPLSISFCLQVSGASLQKLTKNFRTLSINTNDMTPPLVDCLKSLSKGDGKHITELNVCAYNELNSQENILQMICTEFQCLRTLRYSIVSKDLVKYGLFGSLRNLRELVFDCNALNLSDHEMLNIMMGCKDLKSIFIRYEHAKDHNTLTDYSLRKLPLFCPNLVKFNFQSKETGLGVTDTTIESFSQLKHLEFLGFRNFDNI